MALTTQTNGNSGPNIIKASWFNDFKDLLTGVMADQIVTIKNILVLRQPTYTTPTAPTLALVSGTGMGTGAYTFAVTFGMGQGQTLPGTTATITTTSGNNKVALSAIPLGPAGTTSRAVYRSKVGTISPLFLVTTINDNTTTTFTDSTPDASLTVVASAHDKFGGYLALQNQAGTTNAELYPDGAASLSGLALNGRLNNGYPAVQTVVTGNAIIIPTNSPIVALNCTSSVSGITLPNGTNAGDTLFIINTGGTGFTISFSGSNIRDVGNVSFTAGHFSIFIWDGGKWNTR